MKQVSQGGLESYLIELKSQLAGQISERQMTELLYELSLHFHELANDFQANGFSRIESENKALRAMGSTHSIANDYLKTGFFQRLKSTPPAIKALACPFLIALLFSLPFMSQIRSYQVFHLLTLNELAFLASFGLIFLTSIPCKKPAYRHLLVAIVVMCCYHFLSLAPLIVPGPNGTAFWRHQLQPDTVQTLSSDQKPILSFKKVGTFWIPVTSSQAAESPEIHLTFQERKKYYQQPLFSGTSNAIAQTWPTAAAIILFITAPHLLGIVVGNAQRQNQRRLSANAISTSQPRA